jgi:hypothetical protein
MSQQQYPGQPHPQQWQPQPPPQPKKRRWLHFVGYPGAVILGLIIGAAGASGGTTTAGSDPAPTTTTTTTTTTVTVEKGAPVAKPTVTATKTITAQPPEARAAITEDGTWLVGSEVKPGTYRSGNNPDCYWARLGSNDDIIDNGLGPNQTVTIRRTDHAFETRGCGEWRPIR